MKLLRIIRFDQSDDHVFARAAEVDEWCIPGGFEFADLSKSDLTGKTRQAFANGFLGLPSFGRSTFATVAEISKPAHDEIVGTLARHVLEFYGAPDMAAAQTAAAGEVQFAMGLCADKPINTVFTVRRTLDDGEIREEFREITPPGEPRHTRIWDIVEDDA